MYIYTYPRNIKVLRSLSWGWIQDWWCRGEWVWCITETGREICLGGGGGKGSDGSRGEVGPQVHSGF